MNRWWEKTCPVCGEDKRIERQPSQGDTIRYCRNCKFQWSIELAEWQLIVLAVAHNKKAIQGEGHEQR